MFDFSTPFSIGFFVAVVLFTAVFAFAFVWRLARKSQPRGVLSVAGIVLGFVFFVAALLLGALITLNRYSVGGFSVVNADGALAFVRGGESLFSIPGLGAMLPHFEAAGLSGIVCPFALSALCLMCTVVTLCKTHRVKKQTEQAVQEDFAPQEEQPEQQAVLPPVEHAQEAIGLPPAEPEPKRILGEIEKLVSAADGDDSTVLAAKDDLGVRLRRAIDEGLKLNERTVSGDFALSDDLPQDDDAEEVTTATADTFADETDENETADEETDGADGLTAEYDEIIAEAETDIADAAETEASTDDEYNETADELTDGETNAETDETAAEETDEEETVVESTDDEYNVAADETDEADEVYVVEESAATGVEPRRIVETEFEEHEPQPTREELMEAMLAARPRNVVKRPAAKTPEELAAAAKKAAEREKARKAERERMLSERKTVISNKKRDSGKGGVEPLAASLPLTKRYIILNRQSAVNVFNDYLKQKRESEKIELTENINTIILK